jgi:hypothetical protein
LRTRALAVAKHSAQSLANALEHSSLFLLPVWKALGQITWLFRGSGLVKTLVTTAVIGGAVAALVTVPTDFQVQARGKLQPAHRSEIFAPLDGSSLAPRSSPVRSWPDDNTDPNFKLRPFGKQSGALAVSRILLDNRGVPASLRRKNRLSGEMLQLNQRQHRAWLHDKVVAPRQP